MKSNGRQIMNSEVLNKRVAKTWELGLDIINNKSFWELAAQHGSEFLHFLTASSDASCFCLRQFRLRINDS